ERSPHGKFATPRRTTRKQQAGDIRTRDEQHQSGREREDAEQPGESPAETRATGRNVQLERLAEEIIALRLGPLRTARGGISGQLLLVKRVQLRPRLFAPHSR